MVASGRLVGRLMLLFAVLAAVAPPSVLANHNHFFSDDSVSNGRILYDDDMGAYHNALDYADDTWDVETPVTIRPVQAGETATLRVITINSNNGTCGRWDALTGTDRMYLNEYPIELGHCGRRAPRTVALHEMGHALRIYDHTGTSYWYDVMYVYMIRRDQYGYSWECPLSLQRHDIHDLDYWWG